MNRITSIVLVRPAEPPPSCGDRCPHLRELDQARQQAYRLEDECAALRERLLDYEGANLARLPVWGAP